jgi:uncharacterized protein (DUF1800 family)
MTLPAPSDLDAAIAATRFGLGARPGEIEAARADPRGFLKAQIRAEGADQPQGDLGTSAQNLTVFQDLRKERRELKGEDAAAAGAADLKQVQAKIRDMAIEEMAARGRLAAATPAAFRERWALFWSNHFTVSATKGAVAPIAGAFEREAIRPHVFGRFEDLLLASSQHPAMLLYLDQAASIGPDSPVGQSQAGQRRQAGLNENLAREIMELHTVGVNGGYTQADVTEFARALTGWSISRAAGGQGAAAPGAGVGGGRRFAAGGDDMGPPGTFTFREQAHEPGVRHVLGRSYGQDGFAQGRAVLVDLAAHPATARHVARKIAVHFVADDPPPALTARLERSFTASGGQLGKLAETLIDSPEAWAPTAAKFKTPYEFLISSWRVSGAAPDLDNPRKFAGSMTALGQRPFSAPSPKGWADDAAEWAAPDGIVKRMAWAEAAAKGMAALDPNEFARSALGARLSPQAATAIARAETRPEAFAILLMSPEFQRR